jgi:penicillin-binding protein 2
MQIQVLGRRYWRERATEVMKRSSMIETTRGRILDVKGRVIAADRPCIDACVDYRAIPAVPDEIWVKKIALRRLADGADAEYRRADPARRKMILEAQIAQVRTDIQIMWAQVARLSGKTPEEIDDIRQSIVRKVEMRRRYVWYQRFEQARRGQEQKPPPPWYHRWLIDEAQDAPQLDQFDVEVAEQTDPHVILRAISPAVMNELGRNMSRYPGLELRPSTHRFYPYTQSACHLLGHLSRVNREDLENDPNLGRDELRQYFPNDLVGRTGLEALLEPLLRGARGRLERYIGGGDSEERIVQAKDPAPGQDVRTTIDIELQGEIEALFTEVELENKAREESWKDTLAMPGAAVVIDVATNEVRALVSSPTFDLNDLDDLYDKLSRDDVNRPLMNRATQFQLEPGSTVKPMVGLGAITQGLMTPEQTIECTGFLVMDGKKYSYGRCWVASNFASVLGANVAHHPIPWNAPHPTGYLTFADALERSCNIFFEHVADQLKLEGICYWFDRFGLGRPTGIGIAEVAGHIPNDLPASANRRGATWFAGIGQDQVLATPIQMANVAATLARNGVWMRPRLVPAGTKTAKLTQATTRATTRDSDARDARDDVPDMVDLKLSPAGLAAARRGMIAVVNGAAGTGTQAHHDHVLVAGKTGSAQASRLRRPERDELARIVKDDHGRVRWVEVAPISVHGKPNPEAPWYRGTPANESKLAHAWFIGYAPADDPKLAFAVMVEYGGSGGAAAGTLGKKLLDACIAHGYLAPAPRVTNAN